MAILINLAISWLSLLPLFLLALPRVFLAYSQPLFISSVEYSVKCLYTFSVTWKSRCSQMHFSLGYENGVEVCIPWFSELTNMCESKGWYNIVSVLTIATIFTLFPVCTPYFFFLKKVNRMKPEYIYKLFKIIYHLKFSVDYHYDFLVTENKIG